MNELALFAGAGGGILGGHLLGWRTVCAVEWEAYPASVLVARQNDKILPPFPIWDDVQTFDGKPWRGIVDVVSGGFPCQDISSAGKGGGIEAERSGMWREMARIIGEVRPKYAFVENSPMLTTRGLGTVLRDLAKMGYDAEWGVLGAADVGANHQRDRIWILAYSNGKSDAQRRFDSSISEIGGQRSFDEGRSRGNVDGILEFSKNEEMDTKQRDILSHTEHNRVGWGEQQSQSIEKTDGTMANTNSRLEQTWSNSGILGEQNSKRQTIRHSHGSFEENVGNTESTRFSPCELGQREIEPWRTSSRTAQWWASEPNLDRVVNGMASRVDRLKAIGNGQVPLCAATAWSILMERINES
jgi:DNA (cytosine-5)-methyltransferase 1